MLKLADNPPMLAPTAQTLAELQGEWWVACTRGQHEKALARYLLAREVGYFLPMHERVMFWRKVKRTSLLPLFPCYVFVCGDKQDREAVLKSNRIFRTIEVANQAQLVSELTAIEKALAGKAELELYPSPAVGQRCRIIAGPFEGLEGIVVERRSRARFVLAVGLVGRYLDRDRLAMATLGQLRDIVPRVAEAMARKDLPEFGRLVDRVWRLNNLLDPGSTNDQVEAVLARVRPHVHGAKLLGAGGGGFLLMVCKSPQDAAAVREMLGAEPPNDRARFFEFGISRAGLVVTVC